MERWTGLVVILLLHSKLASREWMFSCGGALEIESEKNSANSKRPTQHSARAHIEMQKGAEPSPDPLCDREFAHALPHCIALPLVRRDAAARDAARRRRPHGPRVSRRPVAPYLLLPGRRNAFSCCKIVRALRPIISTSLHLARHHATKRKTTAHIATHHARAQHITPRHAPLF